MRILLIASPAHGILFTGSSLPHLGLLSIASNLDPRHDVRIIDDYGLRSGTNIAATVREFKPQVVGISAMTFQYKTAKEIARRIKEIDNGIILVLGGYHATVLHREVLESEDKHLFSYLVRNEGERTFDLLVNALETNGDLTGIKGISYFDGQTVYHNEPRERMDLEEIKPPRRDMLKGRNYYFANPVQEKMENIAIIETSRGCRQKCNYCSIKIMYSGTYRAYSIDRVIDDLKFIKEVNPNITQIAIVDDNITLDVDRFAALCDKIVENRLNNMKYFAQCSPIGISQSEELVKKMKKAGFTSVFLGIENNNAKNLKFLGKGDTRDHAKIATDFLNKHDIATWGGIMIGLPDDTEETIKDIYRYQHSLGVMMYACQIVTPYPKTELRDMYDQQGLIVNFDRFEMYDGYWPNIKTNHLSEFDLYYYRFLQEIKYYLLYRSYNRFLRRNFPLRFIRDVLLNPFKYLFLRACMIGGKRKFVEKLYHKQKNQYLAAMDISMYF